VRIDGKANPFAEIAQERDESLAFDVATSSGGRGLVTWDEDAALGDASIGRGVIKVLPMPAQGEKAGSAAVIVSSSGSDVERPRAIARPGGYWVGWIARRVDSRVEPDPKGLESPGEDRSFSWVEIAKVDDGGKRVGDVRKVTSDAGHVTAFDWLAGADGKLDLFARDDAEVSQEGEGGRILRIAVRDDGPQGTESIVSSGVGQGDPEAVGDPGGRWLFYVDVAEHAHGIFLDVASAATTPEPSATLEPALDGQSVLHAKLEHSAALLLAVGPSGEGKEQAETHIIRCVPTNHSIRGVE